MTRVVAIAINTFREAIRNKVLYSLLFFAVLLIISALAFGQVSLHEEARVTRDLGLGGIALFGVLIAIFVGVNLVYKEIDRKTVFTLIPKPIHRYEFILGKFAGMVLTLAVQIAIMSAVLFTILFIQVGSLDADLPPLLRAVALLFLEVSVITAVAVFFSTFTSPFLSGVFTLGIFLVGRSTPELRELIGKLHHPVLKLSLAGALKIVPNLHIFYVSGSMIGGRTVSVHAAFIDWGYVGWAALYACGWSAVALIVSMILFSRRDFV
jgi:ABC-type transport system involved in multi-copper enzyme maturation permease subunit